MGLSFKRNTPFFHSQPKQTKTNHTNLFKRLCCGINVHTLQDCAARISLAEALRAEARIAAIMLRNANSISTMSTGSDPAFTEIRIVLSHLTELIEQEQALDTINDATEDQCYLDLSTLEVARENFIAAKSRVRDADIAQEVANMVRLQVLHQTDAAILAQANQQPRLIFGLL